MSKTDQTIVAKEDFTLGARRFVAGGTYVLSAEDAMRVASKVRIRRDRGPARANRAISAEGIRHG